MKKLLMIAAAAVAVAAAAGLGVAAGNSLHGIGAPGILFQVDSCKVGYEWSDAKKKCVKKARDY